MAIDHPYWTPHHPHGDPGRLAPLFRALSEPVRLDILQRLAHRAYRVGELAEALGLAQSTVSAHLAVLRDQGLVVGTAVGRASEHRIADPEIDRLLVEAEHVLARTDRSGSADDAAKKAAP